MNALVPRQHHQDTHRDKFHSFRCHFHRILKSCVSLPAACFRPCFLVCKRGDVLCQHGCWARSHRDVPWLKADWLVCNDGIVSIFSRSSVPKCGSRKMGHSSLPIGKCGSVVSEKWASWRVKRIARFLSKSMALPTNHGWNCQKKELASLSVRYMLIFASFSWAVDRRRIIMVNGS